MSYLDYLRSFVKDKIQEHPDLANEINDIYELALDEISDGQSMTNECELAISDIKDIISEKEEAKL